MCTCVLVHTHTPAAADGRQERKVRGFRSLKGSSPFFLWRSHKHWRFRAAATGTSWGHWGTLVHRAPLRDRIQEGWKKKLINVGTGPHPQSGQESERHLAQVTKVRNGGSQDLSPLPALHPVCQLNVDRLSVLSVQTHQLSRKLGIPNSSVWDSLMGWGILPALRELADWADELHSQN